MARVATATWGRSPYLAHKIDPCKVHPRHPRELQQIQVTRVLIHGYICHSKTALEASGIEIDQAKFLIRISKC